MSADSTAGDTAKAFSLLKLYLQEVQEILDRYSYLRHLLSENEGWDNIPEAIIASQGYDYLAMNLTDKMLDDVFLEGPISIEERQEQEKRDSMDQAVALRMRLLDIARETGKTNGLRLRDCLGVLQDWTCKYCHRKGDLDRGPDGDYWHCDHVIPKSKGGTNRRENRVLACSSCNLKKRAMNVEEFIYLYPNGVSSV